MIPAGLAARDTLRLEAGMPLYGHELAEQIDPIEAGLKFAVDLEEREFPGSEVLVERSAGGASRKRVGLRLFGRRIPREGYPILDTSEIVGIVTSGTFSPTFECPNCDGVCSTWIGRTRYSTLDRHSWKVGKCGGDRFAILQTK